MGLKIFEILCLYRLYSTYISIHYLKWILILGCPNQKICASAVPKCPDPDVSVIAERLSNVKRKILILSGKGGVGKSYKIQGNFRQGSSLEPTYQLPNLFRQNNIVW